MQLSPNEKGTFNQFQNLGAIAITISAIFAIGLDDWGLGGRLLAQIAFQSNFCLDQALVCNSMY